MVHHIGDSHLNSYVRFKWALTEEKPLIKTYDEKSWAELADNSVLGIEDSLNFTEMLHKKWVAFLKTLTDEDLNREFVHPDSGAITLRENIGMYSWHGRHHVAHITSLRTRMNW